LHFANGMRISYLNMMLGGRSMWIELFDRDLATD